MIRREAYVTALALLTCTAVGSALILAFGQSPWRVYSTLLANTWGSSYGTGQVLFKATPLIFTGLAVALAFRVGLFNIGAEGQMAMGALATAVVGTGLPIATPAPIAVVACVLAGAAVGGLYGAVPGVLRARFGAHEVINTIMLNFIAAALVMWVGRSGLFVQESAHTAPIIAAAELPGLGVRGSAVNLAFVLAVWTAAAVWWFLRYTRVGFEWCAVGANPLAAEAAGVRRGAAVIGAMAFSGALAGLVGSNYVLGYKHYFEQGMHQGAGFMGIAVALLGRNHPAGVVAAALLFGTLSHGGFAINALVPAELVEVLQATIVLALVVTAGELRRRAGVGRAG